MIKKNIYLILSFLFPFIILGTMFALHKVYPFGNRQIIVTDFWHQYYPFLSDYWHKLREGRSLLWSWTSGSGSDYLGVLAYYLASPLNLLNILFPHEWLREVLTVTLLIKLSFAGLFMTMYLRYTFKRCDLSLPIFASLYALCAFTLGYYWNIMWFDSFALLPLVMLGIQAFMREGKYRLYIVSLALAVFTNYYIGFFICIFVAIMFLSQCFVNKINQREFFHKLVLIVMYSFIAVGLTALITIPAYSSLKNSYSIVSEFPKTFRLNHSFIDILGNLIAFTPPTPRDGLPNLYSGMISLLLAAVFMKSKKITIREKIVYISIVAFLILSCNLNVLDYIWHGFHYTNMLPSRFSFLISFMLVVIAYQAYLSMETIDMRDLIASSVAAALFILIAIIGPQEKNYIIGSGVLCAVYLGIFAFYIKANKTVKKVINVVFLIFILIEISITSYIGVKTTATTDRTDYLYSYDQVQQLLDMRQLDDSDFYRTELTKWYTLNAPSLYGYDGISFFSSTANVSVTKFMGGLGLAAWDAANRYNYAETSPLTNLFLDMRYLINPNGDAADKEIYWKPVGEAGGSLLLENNHYLPLGFMANDEVAGYIHDEDNPFVSQNELFQKATGLNGDLFTIIDMIHVGHKNYDVYRNALGNYSYNLQEGSTEGMLKWNYEMPANCMLYAYCKMDNVENIQVSVDGNTLRTIEIKQPYLFTVGRFAKDELVSIMTNLKAQKGNAVIYVAYINQEIFDEGYNQLADEKLILTKFTETEITGNITVLNDGLLYTSIPHEKRWKAFVDGIETDIQLVDSCMAAIPLSEGTHKIEFHYYNNSFTAGIIVSIISLISFVVLIIFDMLIHRKYFIKNKKIITS